MTPRLIGIKRKPCEVSKILDGTSLNSDIKLNDVVEKEDALSGRDD